MAARRHVRADAEAIAESLTEAPGLPIALGRDAATLRRPLPDRIASQTRSISPCHDRVPVRLDHRPLHQPHPR